MWDACVVVCVPVVWLWYDARVCGCCWYDCGVWCVGAVACVCVWAVVRVCDIVCTVCVRVCVCVCCWCVGVLVSDCA